MAHFWNFAEDENKPSQEYDQRARLSSIPKNFLEYMLKGKNGFDLTLKATQSLLAFAGSFGIHNKKYNKAIKFLRYTIPATIMTSGVVNEYKEYLKVKERKDDAYHVKSERMRILLGFKDSIEDLKVFQFKMGSDIVRWVFSGPKTKGIKIQGFYDAIKMEKVLDVSKINFREIYILLEYEGDKYAWRLHAWGNEEGLCIKESNIIFSIKNITKVDNIRNALIKEFIDNLGTEENVLYIDDGIRARKRQVITQRINQFDVPGMSKEIHSVLEKGLKRTYAILGIPGVGKSTVIRKLEELERGYPFLYIGPNNLRDEETILETFKTLKYLQPFIAVIEDLDSMNFRTKDTRLGTFLDEIDSVNNRLNGVILVTVNDTSIVHYSLMNRPGRIDQVMLIEPPIDDNEIYEVMKIKYDSSYEKHGLKKSEFIDKSLIQKSILDYILKNRLTHADICEIIEKALLEKQEITPESLEIGYKTLKNSKEAIKKCSFEGNSPRVDSPCNDYPTYGTNILAGEPRPFS